MRIRRKSVPELILYGTDDEILAAASDPTRRKVSAAQAMENAAAVAKLTGVSADDAAAALRAVANAMRVDLPSG
jgi:hypothetical protein